MIGHISVEISAHQQTLLKNILQNGHILVPIAHLNLPGYSELGMNRRSDRRMGEPAFNYKNERLTQPTKTREEINQKIEGLPSSGNQMLDELKDLEKKGLIHLKPEKKKVGNGGNKPSRKRLGADAKLKSGEFFSKRRFDDFYFARVKSVHLLEIMHLLGLVKDEIHSSYHPHLK